MNVYRNFPFSSCPNKENVAGVFPSCLFVLIFIHCSNTRTHTIYFLFDFGEKKPVEHDKAAIGSGKTLLLGTHSGKLTS